tara:strand:- start:540 stop:1424 length:885 start_codon:yes stop_codon:yes gene_type:complete
MPEASNGDTTLFYDTMGSPDNPTILLIMGLGAQMVAFREEFCQLLVDAGFHIVRFDNRDVGLSSKTSGTPPALQELLGAQGQDPSDFSVPYVLSDMSDDAIAVLDAVGVEKAHLVGVSMGGMIAQTMVIEHPERISSLTSIMSTTGNPEVGAAKPELMMQMPLSVPTSKEEAIANSVETFRLISGPHFDPEDHANETAMTYDRNWNPNAQGFQIAAIFASGDRTEALRTVDVPILVIHGRLDPLVQISGGEATASAAPNSKLVVFDDMGHDLPEALWADITDEIINHAQVTAEN